MKLTRRRVWVTASIFMIVAALSLFILFVFGGDRITQANFDCIQEGMSYKQVCEILGPPTENVTSVAEMSCHKWEGKSGTASLMFESDGMVAKKFSPNDSIWSRVKRFFGL